MCSKFLQLQFFISEMPFDFSSNQNVSSSQHPNTRVDMSDSKTKDNSKAENFDSGIISEGFISSEISSEIDVKDDQPTISRDNSKAGNIDSGILSEGLISSEISSEIDIKDDQPTISKIYIRGKNLYSDKKIESVDTMNVDSGIDLSDQQYSRSEFEKPTVYKTSEEPEVPNPQPVVSIENLYQKDEDGDTQLHDSVLMSHEEAVKYIVLETPNSSLLDIQNIYAQTCMHLAVAKNLPRITRLLLLAGARTNIEDRDGNTPLHLACKMDHSECLEALLTPVTAYDRTYYPFKYIPDIDSPRNYLNEVNYDGLSCIHIAAKHRNLRILHNLLLSGADVNVREWKGGYTILHGAVLSGDTEMVRYILHHPKIDVEKKNYAMKTAYQLCADYPDIEELLVNKDAQRLEFIEDEIEDTSDESDSEDDNETCKLTLEEKVEMLVSRLNSFRTASD